ncbi:MAG: hypothetical protein WCA20_22340 [Candidatus Sulfotelmatobacter sp.]
MQRTALAALLLLSTIVVSASGQSSNARIAQTSFVLDLNMDVVREHPYDPNAYFDTSKPGWERRLGAGAKRIA